ncbi:MAG: MBL fold metallo-hydrolase [Chloroflexi bacterium]|nr:MBL fold metallo-hydrolase [Chloroflexota bacterium]
MEIVPHVHSLDVKIDWFPQPYPPNVHLVIDGDEGALIDAGFSDEQSISGRLEMLKPFAGLKLRYIVITHHHFDHASGANRLREATGARIVMHEDEAPLLARAATGELPADVETPPERKEWRDGTLQFREESAKGAPDETVSDGDTLSIGGLTLRMVHTPGHTAGHISPFLEQGRVLFAGDNVLGVGTTAIPPPPHGDMAQYVESLKKMQTLEADVMCCGHGPVVREPNRKLQELIDHRRERDEQILALVREGRDTVKRIVRAVYPELDKRLLGMATGQIISHLAKLEGEGKVRSEGEGDERRVEAV